MNEVQSKAWDCLTELEQQALFLRFSGGKSSWESGTILNLSHYKYLELRERSEKFFKMFTDFFELHPAIFRPNSPCEQSFIDYIEGLIELRLSKKESVLRTGNSVNLLAKYRSKVITRNIQYLKDSEDKWDLDTLFLIQEFDRWNNFRILPHLLQQPSAYKRRSNKRDKIYIKYLLKKLPDWVHEKIIEKHQKKETRHNKPRNYIALVSENLYMDSYKVIPISNDTQTLSEMSKLYIYVFDNKEDADSFGFMVSKYVYKTYDIKLGQKFWPEFRNVLSHSLNYNAVNNMHISIKSLDTAYEVKKVKPKKNKNKPTGLKRADERLFDKI